MWGGHGDGTTAVGCRAVSTLSHLLFPRQAITRSCSQVQLDFVRSIAGRCLAAPCHDLFVAVLHVTLVFSMGVAICKSKFVLFEPIGGIARPQIAALETTASAVIFKEVHVLTDGFFYE